MDTKHGELTAAEHVERAQSQGQTVAELPKAITVEALEALLPWNVKALLHTHSTAD